MPSRLAISRLENRVGRRPLYSIIGRRSRHRFENCLAIRYTPENESNENFMQGLMNRQQATARLMRGSHHVAGFLKYGSRSGSRRESS